PGNAFKPNNPVSAGKPTSPLTPRRRIRGGGRQQPRRPLPPGGGQPRPPHHPRARRRGDLFHAFAQWGTPAAVLTDNGASSPPNNGALAAPPWRSRSANTLY